MLPVWAQPETRGSGLLQVIGVARHEKHGRRRIGGSKFSRQVDSVLLTGQAHIAEHHVDGRAARESTPCAVGRRMAGHPRSRILEDRRDGCSDLGVVFAQQYGRIQPAQRGGPRCTRAVLGVATV